MVAAHKNDLNLETYSAIWLNLSSHTSEETSKLWISINHLKIFEDCNQCKDYIRSISSENRLILIVDDRFARQIVRRIEQLRQVSSIYFHSLNKNTNQQWTEQFLKVNKHFLLFDCLFWMPSNNKTEFLSLCKTEYKNNENELNIIHKFEQNYSSNQALSWYTTIVIMF